MSYDKKITCPHCSKEMPMARVVHHTFGEIEKGLIGDRRKLEMERRNIAMSIDAVREKAAEKVHRLVIELSEREQFKLREKDQIIDRLTQRIAQLEGSKG